MEKLSKEWFELADHRKRSYSRAVWIPVYGTTYPIKVDKYPNIGFVEETLAVGSAVIFNDGRAKAEELEWSYWNQSDTIPYVNDQGKYHDSTLFHDENEVCLGFRIILSQYLNSLHPRQVSLHQDFIHAYALLNEGNKWLRPNEAYAEVVRMTENDKGDTIFVEIRAEYLRDYLAARKAALRLYCYRQRQAIFKDNPNFDWPEDFALTSEQNDKCEVHCYEINASGKIPGSRWASMKVWQTDVDVEEDVPDFSQGDDGNIATESKTGVQTDKGRRFLVTGELWRGEWIDPAKASCRIGYLEPKENLLVSVDGSGSKVDLESLNFEVVGKYLWFGPSVVPALLEFRGSNLKWYTRDTGGVSAGPDGLLHFGVNSLGFVNAYAYDVARLPLWERRIWVSNNCRPDGGVSSELLQAQMQCEPAESDPPELMLLRALQWINMNFEDKFGLALLRDHHEVGSLSNRIHRFRATSEIDLKALAKDVVKISIERIDKKSLVTALGEKKSDLGTLKLLERLLGQYTGENYACRIMAPLFGVYDLRSSDAHLSHTNIEDSYTRIGIDRKKPLVVQGALLLEKVGTAFGVSGRVIEEHIPSQ